MRRAAAAVGSAAYFVVEAGTFGGLVPWLIAGRHLHDPLSYPVVARAVGAVLICVGLIPVISAFVHFARARGTPLPLAPTEHLVVTGFHRYVRNPIYLGSLVIFLGEAVLYGCPTLLIYTAAAWAMAALFVRYYEEPDLARRFGADYNTYRHHVPAWHPRPRAWTPPPDEATVRRQQ
jgi:protein-S-isoprenylcysteine O-methyltransferase Ste14